VLCSLVSVTRLQALSVDQGEVVTLVTVQGRLVLVDENGLPNFSRQGVVLLAKDLFTGPVNGVACTLHVLGNCRLEFRCLYNVFAQRYKETLP